MWTPPDLATLGTSRIKSVCVSILGTSEFLAQEVIITVLIFIVELFGLVFNQTDHLTRPDLDIRSRHTVTTKLYPL